MTDTRTDAERAYDATRLSPMPEDEATSEMIAEAEAMERAEDERLERLGLAPQVLKFAFNKDHKLWLFGDGTMTICGEDGIPAIILDLQQTASLITFLHSPLAERLIPAIMLASLRERGGPGADLADEVVKAIDEGRGKELLELLNYVREKRWPAA